MGRKPAIRIAMATTATVVAWGSVAMRAWRGAELQHVRRHAFVGRGLQMNCGLHVRGKPVHTAQRRVAAAADADVSAWSPRELRRFLDESGVRHTDCFERQELVERARQTLAAKGSQQDRAPRSDARRFDAFGELVTTRGSASTPGQAAAMIFLHGLGDTAQGWASMLPSMLQVPEMSYLVPTAETLSVPGAFGGQGVTSWFDASVLGMLGGGSMTDTMKAVGPDVMTKSVEYCHHLVRQELQRGVPAGRIFLGGFSQGGCVAVRAALSFPDASLGGCVAASTFIGDAQRLPIAEANANLKVLCCHGEADQVVPLSEGFRLWSSLKNAGLNTEWRTYPGLGHSSNAEEAVDIRRFILRRLVAHGGEAGLQALSARALKALLRDVGVDPSRCFEKADLFDLARRTVLS